MTVRNVNIQLVSLGYECEVKPDEYRRLYDVPLSSTEDMAIAELLEKLADDDDVDHQAVGFDVDEINELVEAAVKGIEWSDHTEIRDPDEHDPDDEPCAWFMLTWDVTH